MRRVLTVAAGVVVVLAGFYGLLSLVTGRDDAGVSGGTTGPGVFEPAGTGGEPPTSGPHRRVAPTSQRHLSRAALLTALEAGDVVIVHPPGPTPPALERLQRAVSGPFDPELAAAGQMVIVTGRPGVDGVQALAFRRRLKAAGPADPRLRAFAEAWLGAGRGKMSS